jgi:hypothetical protein
MPLKEKLTKSNDPSSKTDRSRASTLSISAFGNDN